MTRLSDLSFLPQKGRTIFEIDIHRISTSETLNRANGTVVASDRAAVSSILRLYHGITNQLTVGTYLQQALNDQTSNSYGPASTQNGVRTTTQTQGPFDPSFFLEYRALTQGPDPINSFVGFTLKPSIVDAKSPTTTSNGTNGSGGHTATLSGRIVYEAEHIGTELQSAFTFKDKRTTKDETAGTSTDITGGDVFQIAATAQAKLSNLLTMNLGLVWYAIGATESRTGSNPNTIVSAFTYTAYTISARTTLVPDQLMLFLTLQGVGSVNSKLKSNSIEYDDSISSNSVTVGGAFMF
jgi:hypothetical protein